MTPAPVMLDRNRDEIIQHLPAGLSTSKETLSGFGRYGFVDCVVVRPKNLDEIRDLLAACAANDYVITPKGSGCSFADGTTNRQGIVLDMSSWNKILDFDPATGLLTVLGGTSAGRILHHTLPYHWILRALPGTSAGTVAGFIANNVHGKESKGGNFGGGVVSMRMLLANGEIINLSRDEHPDVFHAAVGGMGLLGIIIEATLQLVKISGSLVETETQYFSSIPDLFSRFSMVADDVDMGMAWFDGFHETGRGILQTARWVGEDPDRMPPSMEHVKKKFMGKVPIGLLYPMVRPFACRLSMSAANKMAFLCSKMSSPRRRLHLYQYYYPHMTTIPDSPKALKGGLVGFHILVPTARSCEFIVRLLALCRRHKFESWFGGVKRLEKDPFLMSFADDGYAVTIEMPGRFTKRPTFAAFFDAMVSVTIEYEGRMNLGKDALLAPSHVKAMYPRLAEFLDIRNACDPNRLFGSDLSRRLAL